MNTVSLYIDKDSFIHKLNTLTKIFYIIFAIAFPNVLGMNIAFYGVIFCSLIILTMGKVLKAALKFIVAVALLLLTIVIIQGLVYNQNVTPMFALGNFIFYREGLLFASRLVLNILNIVLAFAIFILTTTPASMTETLIRCKVSPRIAYVFSSVFQIIPEMFQTVHKISIAQQSRGVVMSGNVFIRIKSFIPLLSPAIMTSLMMTKERAIALEIRGFNRKNEKVFLHVDTITLSDVIIWCILFLGMILSMTGRIII